MFEIKIAEREHLSLVAELERATFFDPWSEKALELFVTDGGFCVICLEDGALCSYCTLTTVLDEAQIINVATSDPFKRRGCARAVIERVLNECKKRGIAFISLEVRESNSGAIALYESLNFAIVGKRNNFYTNPRENALVMVREKLV